MNLIACSKVIYKPVLITLPDSPTLPAVKFQQSTDGVLLDFQNARALAEREVLIRAYIEKLRQRILINNNEAVR